MRRFWSAAQRRVKKVDGDVRTAWHDDDDPGTYKQLRAPARRRPTRGDEGGVSGGGGAVVHGGAAHLARRRQAAVVCGILTGGLGRGSGRLRIEARPDRGPQAALMHGRCTWPGSVAGAHMTDRATPLGQ
jgi:hypothetical protein